MKILVVYYSRSGKTKLAAETLATALNAQIEAINDLENHSGVFGFLRGGHEAVTKKSVKIVPLKAHVDQFDLVVICSPVWAGSISSPVRSFITSYSHQIKKVAYLITRASAAQDYSGVFYEMDKLVGRQRAGEISIFSRDTEKIITEAKKFAYELQEIQN